VLVLTDSGKMVVSAGGYELYRPMKKVTKLLDKLKHSTW